jgi:Mg2+-importing ATPase
MGDGINDASAIHAPDIGISVDTAADVVKEAADIVLLQKDLMVLIDGILEGRKTLANTLKYIFMATSSNFGNVLSMAGASLFLPFLPLLPKQILLTNLLIDIPEMALSTDEVDDKMIKYPPQIGYEANSKFYAIIWRFGYCFRFFYVWHTCTNFTCNSE